MRVRDCLPLAAAVAAATAAVAAAAGCKVREPSAIDSSYTDDYERDSIGGDYNKTGAGYRVADGALNAHGAHNHPLWLARRLPPGDLQIDLDAWSNSPDGDIKVEVYGDGHSFDPDAGRYMATSYVLVFGGWHNQKSILANRDEHGTTMASRTTPKVVPGKHYHWRILRKGAVIDWYIDDMTTPFLHYDDPDPLSGPGHDYFAFDNWESDTWFDNLVIRRPS
ncbi:MAG TPA: hypothetical protein VHE35_10335 [Kofleriaceae bacterium]|nr:hypothetical protein [Kofleriaceae bacterium]